MYKKLPVLIVITLLLAVSCLIFSFQILTALRKESAQGKTVAPSISPQIVSGNARDTTSAHQLAVPVLLETFLRNSSDPSSIDKYWSEELKKLRTDLAALVNTLSGSHRDAIREEISRANWMLEALQIKASERPQNSPDQIVEFLSLAKLKEAPPEHAPTALMTWLEGRYRELGNSLASQATKTISAINNKGPDMNNESLPSATVILDLLDDFSDENVRKQIANDRLLVKIYEFRESAESELKTIKKAESQDAAHKNLALLAQESDNLGVECYRLSITIPESLKVLSKQLINESNSYFATQERKKGGTYQLWALEQITIAHGYAGGRASEKIKGALQSMKDDPSKAAADPEIRQVLQNYPTLRNKLAELAKIEGLRNENAQNFDWQMAKQIAKSLDSTLGWNGLDELTKCMVRDLMVVNLLPIDESRLERPVANLYGEAFQECWGFLEGSPQRLEVAKATATVIKKQPNDMQP